MLGAHGKINSSIASTLFQTRKQKVEIPGTANTSFIADHWRSH